MSWKVRQKTLIGAIWDVIKIAIIVCIFFWFEWFAGILAILLTLDID